MAKYERLRNPGSFRDPSGHMIYKNGLHYRVVNHSFKDDFDFFIKSGLFKLLVGKRYLVGHKEEPISSSKMVYKFLLPDQIPFISYPYEWSFSQLKDAALLTLEVQKIALNHNMTLKDASAYNVQFLGGRPIMIDTLSFKRYSPGKPWVAYQQFCQHFLAPLALLAKTDLRLNALSELYLDGIPLDLTARLLPGKTRFSFGLGLHLFMHARSQKNHETKPVVAKHYELTKQQQLGLIDNLISTVSALKLPRQKTVWDDYYNNTNYTPNGLKDKQKIIEGWIQRVKPQSVWDAGANDGFFSRLASKKHIFTLATDFDPMAIEKAYGRLKNEKDQYLMPLIIDLVNPSPSVGWGNVERRSFLDRTQVDLSFCLALVHHLAISNNISLTQIAQLFHRVGQWLIIEFVPKEDSNTKRLLANREDVFIDYTQPGFERSFSKYFSIIEKKVVKDSSRTLYLLKKKHVKNASI